MTLDDRLAEIAAKVFRLDPSRIPANLRIGDLPEWDSLGQLILLTEVEREFAIRFDGQQLINLSNLEAIRDELAARGAES